MSSLSRRSRRRRNYGSWLEACGGLCSCVLVAVASATLPHAARGARWDRLIDPLPGSDIISHSRMEATPKADFFMAGVDITMVERVRSIPNQQVVTHDDAGIDAVVFVRTTFSIRF